MIKKDVNDWPLVSVIVHNFKGTCRLENCLSSHTQGLESVIDAVRMLSSYKDIRILMWEEAYQNQNLSKELRNMDYATYHFGLSNLKMRILKSLKHPMHV